MNYEIKLNDTVTQEINKQWETEFSKREFKIPYKKTPTTFISHSEFVNFLNEEFAVWSKTLEEHQLSNLTNKIKLSITSSTHGYQVINNTKELLNLINTLSNQKEIVYSKSPEGKYISKLDPIEAKGFHKYLTKKPFNTRNDDLHSKLIYGAFLGILFEKGYVKKKEVQDLLDSPEAIFNDYQTEYEININNLTLKKKELESEIARLQNFVNEFELKINEDIKGLNEKWNSDVTQLVSEKKTVIETLEVQYSEMLKLSGPTQYWTNLSKTYKNQGILWSLISFIIAIGLGCVVWILSSNLNLADTEDITNTLHKYLIVGVTTSIGFYLLSQGVKITMSRFHLSTDYEERAQLTNVYLALIKEEENYPTEEKQIILQSIFSRSESGLIKGDSGPVMPNNFFSQMIKNSK
ncbi:MAG: DUF6161 domain-containing protein [Bacillota bacterium]